MLSQVNVESDLRDYLFNTCIFNSVSSDNGHYYLYNSVLFLFLNIYACRVFYWLTMNMCKQKLLYDSRFIGSRGNGVMARS